MNVVKRLYCVLWAGHDGLIVPSPSAQPWDDVICRRCGEKQGVKGWWNVGSLHPTRWRVHS